MPDNFHFDSRLESMTVEHSGDGAIVVSGDIDMAGGPVLEAAVLAREDANPIVIDVGGVRFIDSSGLRSLLSASRRAVGRGTFVILRSVGPEVRRLLEITGTESMFTIEFARD